MGVPDKGKARIEAMFDDIAPRYDLLNRVLSFGIDRFWRRKAVDLLRHEQPARILDIATGTGDLAVEALRLDPKKIVGVDLSERMLALAREKVARLGESERVEFRQADAARLPYSDRQFHAVFIAFGARNFEDLHRCLVEIRRVLRPGGTLVVLEFGRPIHFPVKQLHSLYTCHVLPRVGGALSHNDDAYRYLPETIATFPYGDAFLEHMHKAGYEGLLCCELTLGIALLYSGTVPA